MYGEDSFATGYAVGRDSNNNYGNNGFGFGNGWEGLIGLALVAGLFGGWGGGFGFGGNRGVNYATQADLSAGFANSEIMSDLNSIILGQAQMQNFINQGFAGVNQTVTTGFANLNTALCSLGYNIQGGFNDVSRQISDCCCTTQRAIDGINYNMATNTCNIIRANQDNTQRVLDFLISEKLSAKDAKIASLEAQISNDRQSRYIVDELRNGNCPVPAYITCDPRVPVNYNSCGCC